MIKYRVRFNRIERVNVERETEKFVVLPDGKREAKRTDRSNWFDSWEEAKWFLVNDAERVVNDLRNRLDRAKGKLGQLKGMTPPATNEVK